MKFTQLRLTGFKSFVDPTELRIDPGLTGVIGPNGCGKSNLLEALRWVMGATSAKSLRGDGMEDVIFSGTDNRPARNHAEVMLTVDHSHNLAPARFPAAAAHIPPGRFIQLCPSSPSPPLHGAAALVLLTCPPIRRHSIDHISHPLSAHGFAADYHHPP